MKFNSVWVATSKRAKSPLKFIVYDYKSDLMISENHIEFRDGTNSFRGKILSTKLALQTLNWPLHLVGILLFLFLWKQLGFSLNYNIVGTLLLYPLTTLALAFAPWVKIILQDSNGSLKELGLM
jgi:hypothetical protein